MVRRAGVVTLGLHLAPGRVDHSGPSVVFEGAGVPEWEMNTQIWNVGRLGRP